MRHHLNIAHQWILAAFILFLCIITLFTLDGTFVGKATTAQTTVRIVASTPTTCTFIVSEGYNLISIPCLSTATEIWTVTNNTPVYSMYQYVPGDTDGWRVYNPNLPSYVVSDLQFLTRRAGYIIFMNGTANVTLSGILVASTDVGLSPGWNLVGYPSNDTRNISTAFGATNSSLRVVIAFNKSSETFINYTYPAGTGTLREIVPGYGLWINASAAATWTVQP